MRALIVDDEKIICDGLSAMVPWEELGFDRPDTAFNGVQAFEKMQQDPYDLLITDILMPLMDGLCLCQKVHENFPDCTLMILSGYGDFQYAQKAIDYGVKSYLLKPVDENKLMEFLVQFTLRAENKTSGSVSEDRFYLCELPFPDRSLLPASSAAEYGRESVLCMTKGDPDSALNCLKEFILYLRSIKPDRRPREELLEEYLRPVLRMAEELNMEEGSEPVHKTIRSCFDAQSLTEIYGQLAALTVRLVDFVNGRMLAGRNRVSDEMAAYIKDNYSKKISATGIADHFHLSPAYCGRLFKEEQGVSILQYLHNERIVQAKKLLTDSEDKLEYIALQVGYSEISAFYAQFKRITNMTPEQYRKLSRTK